MGTDNRYRRICAKGYSLIKNLSMKPESRNMQTYAYQKSVSAILCTVVRAVLEIMYYLVHMRKYWKQRKTCGIAPTLIHGIPQNSPRYSPRYFQWERALHWVRSVVLWAKAGKLMRMRLLDLLREPLHLDGRCRLSQGLECWKSSDYEASNDKDLTPRQELTTTPPRGECRTCSHSWC